VNGIVRAGISLATVLGAAAMAAVATAVMGLAAAVIVILALDAVVLASMGALIVYRQPENTVGRLLGLAGFGLVLTFSGYVYGAITSISRQDPNDAIAMAMSWLGSTAFYPTFALIALIGLFFPDGQLPSPRWRRPIQATLAVLGASVFLIAIRPGPIEAGLGNNPFGIDHPAVLALGDIAYPLATAASFLLLAMAAAAVAVRFRRARGESRAQMKWFLAAAAVFATLMPLSFLDTAFIDSAEGVTVFDFLSMGSLALLPLSIAIAVLRYRLYAIDRIVSRTLGWATVTAVLIAVYLAALAGLHALLADVTQANTVAVAVSTLVAFALFQPLRRRVQSSVDRRFDRARYDSVRVVESFASRLRHELDLDALSAEVRRVAAETVRPASVAVWLRPAGDGRDRRTAA
jgi:hypothetical protein